MSIASTHWPSASHRFCCDESKQAVASELSEKTEIVQRVELLGAQRDLYESVPLQCTSAFARRLRTAAFRAARAVIAEIRLLLGRRDCDDASNAMIAASLLRTRLSDDEIAELGDFLQRRCLPVGGVPISISLSALGPNAGADRRRVIFGCVS
jgi:SNF2 family DNA or RNA helicase